MGRTPKPLKILVTDPRLLETPAFQALKAKGHTLMTWADLKVEAPDFVMGPDCWRMTHVHLKYLELAIKAARELRYPKDVKPA